MRNIKSTSGSLCFALLLGVSLGLLTLLLPTWGMSVWFLSFTLGPVVVAFLVRQRPYLWGLVPSPIMVATLSLTSSHSPTGSGQALSLWDVMAFMGLSVLFSMAVCFIVYLREKNA